MLSMVNNYNKTLVVVPSKFELNLFIKHLTNIGNSLNQFEIGKIDCFSLEQKKIIIADGGIGKVQYGITSQYLISNIPNLSNLICIGAAGSLNSAYKMGDIIVGTETIEHDYKKINKSKIPIFNASKKLIDEFKKINVAQIYFDKIASGDEDIANLTRKNELYQNTNAACVAWEGAGGARAAKFNNIDFIEIRGITDLANKNAENDFFNNLEITMKRLAELINAY